MKELLKRLSNAAGQPAPSTSTNTGQDAAPTLTPKSQAMESGRSIQCISTTISLLSTLCRGSPTITHVIAHSASIALDEVLFLIVMEMYLSLLIAGPTSFEFTRSNGTSAKRGRTLHIRLHAIG